MSPEMRLSPVEQLRRRFESVQDQRLERTRPHQLFDIVTIAVFAVICRDDDWSEIELFGHSKREFFEQFLLLPNGIPSHDTFNRMFAKLNAQQFGECFLQWVQDLFCASGENGKIEEFRQIKQIVSIDGKSVKVGIKGKRLKYGWNPHYLLKVLLGSASM
ncbi:MAG: ISAs1 family transposase [Chloroflexota bacterium]|nr:ISAs1 family transposase [Chloroflexota bacterium]